MEPKKKRLKTRGRKTKLTPEIQEKICNLVRAGHYKRVAAQQCGIDERTLYEWVRKGDANEPGSRQIYREFRQALESAEAESEIILLDKVMKLGTGRDILAVLARRFPERWGQKVMVQPTGPGSSPDNPIHHHHDGRIEGGATVVIATSDDVWQPTDDPGFFEAQTEELLTERDAEDNGFLLLVSDDQPK